jgi:hypothetical protein
MYFGTHITINSTIINILLIIIIIIINRKSIHKQEP